MNAALALQEKELGLVPAARRPLLYLAACRGADGHVVTYDANGNPTTRTRNALGQALQVAAPEVTYTYAYDPVGRLTGIWTPSGEPLPYVHDAGGRLMEKWFPNGVNARYAYNPDNTLSSESAVVF